MARSIARQVVTMVDAQRIPLPPGLPDHLCVGDKGYEALCSLLGVMTRDQKQALVNSPPVKQRLRSTGKTPRRHLKTAERIRQSLLALYSDPRARRELWLNILYDESRGDSGAIPFPSLEHAALSRYDDAMLVANPDPERLADIEAFHSPECRSDERCAPALASMLRLKQDFIDWSSVPPSRKPEVLAAAFAAATLIDDARLLRWAADRESDISDAYAFLGNAPAAPAKEKGLATASSASDLPAKLREHSMALRDAASDLAEQLPTAELFDKLSHRYSEIVELREPVLAQVYVENVDNLVAGFEKLLNEKASTSPWLAEEIESLLAAWRQTYSQEASTRHEQLRTDIDRAVANLDANLSKVATTQAHADAAKAALDGHAAAIATKAMPSRADRQQETALSQELAKAGQAVIDAMDEVISALQPNPTCVPPTVSPTSTDQEPTTPQTTAEDSVKTRSPKPSADTVAPREAPSEPEATKKTIKPQKMSASTTDVSEKTDKPSLESSPTVMANAADSVLPSPDPARPVEAAPLSRAQIEGPEKSITDPLPATQAAAWRAVGSGRLGLAYHIARLDQATGGNPTELSPELLAAVALGRPLQGPHDELADAFGQRVGLLSGLDFRDVEQPIRDALNLLLFVATLRPALFASQQGASIRLLRRVELSGELTPVFRLAAVIADRAEKLQGVYLDVPTLTAILDEGVWKDRIAAHAQDVKTWREGAAAARFLFAGASAVWHQWLGARGILGELARLLAADRVDDMPRVQELADLLGDRKAIHTLIEDTDRRSVGRYGERISGRALTQLENHLEAPCDLALIWLRIMEARPGSAGFVETAVEDLRRSVDKRAPAAVDAIKQLRETQPDAPLAAALTCALEAIESLANLFKRGGDVHPEIVLRSIQALSDDLLFVTGLRVTEDGTIDDSLATDDALALLIDADTHAATFGEAFNARLDSGDLYGANAVCDRMAAEDDEATDDARRHLDDVLAKSRTTLQRQLYKLTEQIEQAFVIGEMLEDQRAELTAAVANASRRLEDEDGALAASNDVAAIAAEVEPSFARCIGRVREQLDPYLPLDDRREEELLQDALQAGDLATLHEQLDCLKNGQSLLSPHLNEGSRLRAFLNAANHIDVSLTGDAEPTQDAIVEALSHGEDVLGLPFSALSPAQAKRSAQLLERWFLMARQRSPDAEFVAGFFGGLGFTLIDSDVEPGGNAVAALRTEPLRARELCPTHSFGSDAGGRYDLVFNWDAPARERIVQAVSSANPNAHTVVLHFGKLSRDDRNWLRHWSIEHATQFLTVDETLVLYLASLSGGALRTLFDCTLPFTSAEPYFTAPGLVPPEAFFGRESERRTIINPSGSCFVYGGRQLGKTALLHAAQAAFHDPGAHRLAKYVDLKYQDVGIAFGADHIWQVLWREFVDLDVIDSETTVPRGRSLVNAIVEKVIHWLDEREDSRILLLLDEADAFLDADAKLKGDFPVSTRLKGLMDETGRRFKVVLCGLHNVLRNTERANHPLAHFGEPVCVGPLLSNGDLEQARALVREPMAAVGYAFESENLITQILIWTNYYPSLIQIYGQALLRHLRQAPGRDCLDTVTSDDVQAVFARDQFRDYIRNRFSLTLQLDQRYEVVAYAMAADLQGTADQLSYGLPISRIVNLAREYWPDGFNIPEREFGTLLQEMCGLGVLRQRPSDGGAAHYVFRNPNVIRLLGDSDTILEVLYRERDLPDIFEASSFHAQYGRAKTESPRRGPLTYEQEALLKHGRRLAVVCGTRAVNLDDISTFLHERLDQGRLRHLKSSADGNALARELNRLRPDRDTYVCLVAEGVPWTLRWLDLAADALRTAQRGGNLRVVFRADPDWLWDFMADLPDEYLAADNSLFDWVPAQPWNATFLRRWCSDQGLHEASTRVDDLLDLTGGWPLLLEHYADSEEKTWEARAESLRRYISEHHDELLDAVGLSDSKTRRELAPLRAWEALKAEDVDTYAELWEEDGKPPVAADVLRRRLCWATQLGLVQDVDGSTVFNSLIARILPKDTQ